MGKRTIFPKPVLFLTWEIVTLRVSTLRVTGTHVISCGHEEKRERLWGWVAGSRAVTSKQLGFHHSGCHVKIQLGGYFNFSKVNGRGSTEQIDSSSRIIWKLKSCQPGYLHYCIQDWGAGQDSTEAVDGRQKRRRWMATLELCL